MKMIGVVIFAILTLPTHVKADREVDSAVDIFVNSVVAPRVCPLMANESRVFEILSKSNISPNDFRPGGSRFEQMTSRAALAEKTARKTEADRQDYCDIIQRMLGPSGEVARGVLNFK